MPYARFYFLFVVRAVIVAVDSNVYVDDGLILYMHTVHGMYYSERQTISVSCSSQHA